MKLRALDPLLHPQSEDLLHEKSSFVEHFYRLIAASIEPPFAISIDGLWGTGKTTIMQLLQSKLKERDGGYPVFWFNPWEYQENESVILAFLKCLAEQVDNKLGITFSKSFKIFSVIGLVGMDMALSALNLSLEDIQKKGERFEKEYEKEYLQHKNLIKIIQNDFKYLINEISKKRGGKPVIIFFDDLDRCLPDKTIQLLEAVKNLFVVPDTNVIFICGIDTRIAKQFIKSHYKDIEENFAINYFRKIFNLTISMPSYRSEIYDLLLEYIKKLVSVNNSVLLSSYE